MVLMKNVMLFRPKNSYKLLTTVL